MEEKKPEWKDLYEFKMAEMYEDLSTNVSYL